MQHFDRGTEPPPACLSDMQAQPGRDALLEMFSARPEVSAQTRFSMAKYAVEDSELDSALGRLFRGRCAFCESQTNTRTYRFRPTEEAGPSQRTPAADADRSHLYYTWLTNAWQNLYPICWECLPQEPSVFQVRGARCRLPDRLAIETYVKQPTADWRGGIDERPMLLNPCVNESFRKHMAAMADGRLIALSDRGQATIQHFNLDRPDLQALRARVMSDNLARLDLIEDLENKGSELFAFKDMPHGGAWFLLLHQIARKLGDGGAPHYTISKGQIWRYYSERLHKTSFREDIRQVVWELISENDRPFVKRRTRAELWHGDFMPVAFHIQNFKAIEDLHVAIPGQTEALSIENGQPFAPSLAILGENAAGKSSVLEAIALALSDGRTLRDLELNGSRFMLDPVLMGQQYPISPRTAHVQVTYENNLRSSIHATATGVSETINEEYRDFYEPVPTVPVFAYGAFRLYLKSGSRNRPASNVRSLFYPAYILPNPGKWLASLRGKPSFNEVVRALRSVLAIDRDFDVIEIGEDGECRLVTQTERPGREPLVVRTPLEAVSSGFRSILGMICDVLRGLLQVPGPKGTSLARKRAIVLIDEVEAHLHPRWKLRIIQGLREALPNVTFIVTTHDPLCLRGLAAGEVIVLRRTLRAPGQDQDELPEYVEQLEELPDIGFLTVEQLLTSDLFQLFSTDAPNVEASLARVGDLLAREAAGQSLQTDAERLETTRKAIREQIRRALPIGSTEVERLVHEAVESYLRQRRGVRAAELGALKEGTRAAILAALDTPPA